jgi:hypothetical protein
VPNIVERAERCGAKISGRQAFSCLLRIAVVSFTLVRRRRTTTLTVQLDADIRTNVDLAILTPGYTFAMPVLGGRLCCSSVLLADQRADAHYDSEGKRVLRVAEGNMDGRRRMT